MYEWHDFVGNLGVVLILACYFCAQTARMDIKLPTYSLLNAGGALLIIVSLIYNFNLSSFVIELAWLAISGYSLLRWLRARQDPAVVNDS